MSASNLVQRILEGRQVACPDSALDYGMAQLPHYDAIDTLPEAGARIAEAVIKGERITVVGDFDCDGCTATSVVLRALSAFGADADYIIPHRSEGHGITPPHIERAAQRQSSLVITVDNGSDAHEAVLTANKLGIDLVITDHHTVTGSAAQTPWLVNPMVGTSDPELRKLAGVGVAFYTMLATRSSLRQQGRDVGPLSMCYELVAIGTVADMMTLNKVNRILVSAGLNTINQGKMSLGLKALLQVSGRLKPPISAQDIGFGIAPLINAAGRLADMSMAVDLFMATDPHAADAQANKLVALNEDRKKISARRMRQAMSQIEDDRAGVLCVYQNDWEQGIIGLLAGSLVRMHERPAVAFTSEDANDPEAAVRGSMRSPEQFSAIDAIAQVASERPHLINGFGGHSGAAGMELPNAACIPLFTAALEAAIAAAPAREVKPTRHDGSLSLAEISEESIDAIAAAEPWGRGWELPVFCQDFVLHNPKPLGRNQDTLQCQLEPLVDDNRGTAARKFRGISFRWHEPMPQNGAIHRVSYQLQHDRYNGGVQLLIQKVERSDKADPRVG